MTRKSWWHLLSLWKPPLTFGVGGGEGSLVHVWPIRGCRTREGMFKSLRALTSLVKASWIDPNLKMTLLLIFYLDICLINIGKEILNPIIISCIMKHHKSLTWIQLRKYHSMQFQWTIVTEKKNSHRKALILWCPPVNCNTCIYTQLVSKYYFYPVSRGLFLALQLPCADSFASLSFVQSVIGSFPSLLHSRF